MIAAHADWSIDPAKRFTTIGRKAGGFWVLDVPRLTGDVAALLPRLARAAGGEAVVLGIDCPIGLPLAYAAQLDGLPNFPVFLRGLHPESPFFQVAREIEEVSLARPFYPAGTVVGMGHKLALAQKLGMGEPRKMSRLVDLATASRPAAGQLFWTLGPNQCGKAALAAWRDVLLPGLATLPMRLWPFDGPLRELAARGSITVAETYPAEAMRHLGIKLEGSKRDQAARQAVAGQIFDAMNRLNVRRPIELTLAVGKGFGTAPNADDAFDSLIGALGLINVLTGNRPDAPPGPVDMWEGWVLGQTELPVMEDGATEVLF
jgi:hypothetical protein